MTADPIDRSGLRPRYCAIPKHVARRRHARARRNHPFDKRAPRKPVRECCLLLLLNLFHVSHETTSSNCLAYFPDTNHQDEGTRALLRDAVYHEFLTVTTHNICL